MTRFGFWMTLGGVRRFVLADAISNDVAVAWCLHESVAWNGHNAAALVQAASRVCR